ncbi:peroxide stress protein YaaA [Streptococcus caviae]|uniref:peroxide stress protein YaaA n=1 Tax=Streptococcus sp. 'caviae' TaxID=1915004 RepID=UPI00094BBB63|nr:peroxide stress protein YaaA [Streptococcus sp. 'caviae']OLN82507.1 hypothetical protein BMI76_08560 [Streptococcus sp. 'caviae']
MKFLIPTAKEMKESGASSPQDLPLKAQPIMRQLAALSLDELAEVYKIKPQAAETEYERLQAIQKGQAQTYPALQLFNGLMYRHIKRDGLSPNEQNFLKEHLFITSALYGIIPAFERIAPHRLDFNTKISIGGSSLKNYWRKDYDRFVLENDPVISLLSSEFMDVFSPKVRSQLTALKFLEAKDGRLKSHSTISKKARGAFLTQVIQKQCQSIEDLQTLSFDGFHYQASLSSAKELVFVKERND